jgi:hypothetical protein
MEKANSSVAAENGLLLSARDLLVLTPSFVLKLEL